MDTLCIFKKNEDFLINEFKNLTKVKTWTLTKKKNNYIILLIYFYDYNKKSPDYGTNTGRTS